MSRILVILVLIVALSILFSGCFKELEYRTEEVKAVRIELVPMGILETNQYVFYFDNGRMISVSSFNIDFEPTEGSSYILKYERYVGGEKWTFVSIRPLEE